MPTRPPRHSLVSTSKAARDRDYDKRRGSAASRGYGARWCEARAEFLAANPLCAMCDKAGRVTAATAVDHVIPHKGDPALFWQWSNWQSLCATHHNRDKQAMERGGRARLGCDADGWPIDPDHPWNNK